ncbi:MAG: DNA methyltransferase [Candidatus Bathyarchaeia archaeon]
MHRYFARRPHNVFRRLVEYYTEPYGLVLDPFCGGGVTVVEALRLGRRVVGVDLDPMAVFITRMEVTPIDLTSLQRSFERIRGECEEWVNSLYLTRCPACGRKTPAEWVEWGPTSQPPAQEPTRMRLRCPCGYRGEKRADREDLEKAASVEESFQDSVKALGLWYPRDPIPLGEKTRELLGKGYRFFYELFTKRNLLALAMLFKAVEGVEGEAERNLLELAFSSRLFESSRLAHVKRGTVVKPGHHYWPPPRPAEANVWRQFLNGYRAVLRGKAYSNREVAGFKEAQSFDDLERGATCWVLNSSSTSLPLPDRCVDAVITDPPYGANVNYSELSNFWAVWLRRTLRLEGLIDNREEAIVNRYQGKGFREYERLLTKVFKECRRVLKPEGWLVLTFHSRDLRAWAALEAALHAAGFKASEEGMLYQPPIRAYLTTLHQRERGAMLGDFILSLRKTDLAAETPRNEAVSLERYVVQAARGAMRGGRGATLSDIYAGLVPLLFTSGLLAFASNRLVESILRKHFAEKAGAWHPQRKNARIDEAGGKVGPKVKGSALEGGL